MVDMFGRLDARDRRAYHELLKKKTEELCSNPEKARSWLIKLGIYNSDGTLHKNYGGEE